MTQIKLDCMGMPCPQPVLKCKEAVEADHPAHLVVSVDNAAAAENVARFLGSQGYTTETTEIEGGFDISAVRAEECSECTVMTDAAIAEVTAPRPSTAPNGTLVFITADTLGRGDDDLGAKLMQNFLLTLPEMGSSLWRIILVNSAVRFSAAGSAGLEPLQQLADSGVSILVCGTCLEFFGLLEDKQVGETTNMLDVVTSLDLASKVIQV